MMRLLIYDIDNDRIRTRIAKQCANFGLERVQYSAFWGDLTDNRCEELLLKCSDLLEDEPGRIHIFSMCKSCFEGRTHYATDRYEGINVQPLDRTVNVWFLPDTPARPKAELYRVPGNADEQPIDLPEAADEPSAQQSADDGERWNPFADLDDDGPQ